MTEVSSNPSEGRRPNVPEVFLVDAAGVDQRPNLAMWTLAEIEDAASAIASMSPAGQRALSQLGGQLAAILDSRAGRDVPARSLREH